jgi:hypothetical protein
MEEGRKKDAIILVLQSMKSACVIVNYTGNSLNITMGGHLLKSFAKDHIKKIIYVISTNTNANVTKVTEALGLPTCKSVYLVDHQGQSIISVEKCAEYIKGTFDVLALPMNIENVVDVFIKLKNDGISMKQFSYF